MKSFKRYGFGLIQALFVIILIAGMISLALRYAKASIHRTQDSYEKESAELFLNDAVELSLLAISGYDKKTNNNCLKDINITSSDKRFNASVHLPWYYLYKDSNDSTICSNDTNLTHEINTIDSHGYVMMEIVVESNDSNPHNSSHIRITRRTLQRP